MEKRLTKAIISTAGGTAGGGAKTYKIALPSSWLAELGVTEDNREMELTFDGKTIIVSRFLPIEQFVESKLSAGHDLRVIRYFDADQLCTLIYADFTDHMLRVENRTADWVKTAFGKKELPSWEDLASFLEERCVPRQRAGLREYLESIGVAEYDPLEIIQKTAGRMAEDQQWMEIEVLK